MNQANATPASFAHFAAACLQRDRDRITRDWVERLSSRLGVRSRRMLPTDQLLDHIPHVLGTAAEFIVAPDEHILTAQELVTNEMKDLARLRRQQGYDVQEIIREFDELAQILDGAGLQWLNEFAGTPDAKSVGRVFGRLNRAPLLMGQITVGVYEESQMESRAGSARQLGQFTETLMHQLKTPLGAAEGAALLLENDDILAEREARQRMAAVVRRNLARARKIVDDVRSLALAQLADAREGRFLSVGGVLGEVLLEIKSRVEDDGVRLDVQEPIPDLVVDASRVEIVLLNLIGNAAKYADPAKPVRWVRVSFVRRPESDEWWAEVADNGLGIAPELHVQIFERFFRGHPDAAEGSGLGLSIVREAIEQLGSRLELESEPGRGTTFRFLLPRRAEADAES